MSASDGPWDSTGASPPSTYSGTKKYFHVILIGGGGIGSMTVPSDYIPSTSANTNPTPGDFLSLTDDYTGANGGASGGYVELYIDRTNAGAAWNNIVLTAGAGAQRYGGPGTNPSPSGYKDGTRTTLVYGTSTVQTIYAGAGYASSYNAGAPYDGTLPFPSILPVNFQNNPLPDAGDTANYLAINNVYPVVSGPNLPNGAPFGAQGYLAPNYKTYGGGASQDDSTPAQEGYWWCEYTDDLPSNRRFKSTSTSYALPSGIPSNASHALISLVAPGSSTNSGDALLSYPINVTGMASATVTFTTNNTDQTKVTIVAGLNTKVIKMYNPVNTVDKSLNDFDLPLETAGYNRVDRDPDADPSYIGLTVNVPILTSPPSNAPKTFYVGEYIPIGAAGDWDKNNRSAQGGIWAFNGIPNYGFRNPGAAFFLTKPGPNVVTYTLRGLVGTITINVNAKPYAITDSQGTYVQEQNANYGGIGDPATDLIAKPYYSIAFTYLTSFDSHAHSSQSVGNPNYTISLSPDAFAGYKYLHVTLIGQGGTGHCGPGGGQGGLLEFYLDLDKAGREPGLTFDLIPSENANPAKCISDAVFTYRGYSAVAQCCQGQSSGGSTSINMPSNDNGALIVVQKLKGQDGVSNGLPGGLSPQWQNLYIQSNPNFRPQFVGRTPYTKYPDKGNVYQCYGSGSQSNASFYTSSGPGNAYWSYELTNVLPTSGVCEYNGQGSTQNPIGNYFQNDGSFANQSASSDPIPLQAAGSNRYLHYIVIGPGDAGNGGNNGGSGGYIEAYFDIAGSLVADPQYLNNITVTFAQGLASQVTVTGDSSMKMVYTDPADSTVKTDISVAIAYGSKGLEGDTQFPIDQYTYIVKNAVGPRGRAPDKVAPEPLTLYGYLGKDNVMYGAGGSRGAGGSTYTFGQSGYYWYEFTNTINRKTSWNSNDDTITYPSAVTFFNNYRYLHYVLIGGGMYGTTGIGGAGGALLEGYFDLTNTDRINSYLTIATGNYDFGDGRGPTDNSYISLQNIETDRVNISVALAEGGTAQAYNLGGTTYGPIDTDISGAPMRYTIVQRALCGHDSPLDTSKPAEGYLGMDGKTYGDGGQAHGIYHQQAGPSYWWFEYTNEKPPPSQTSAVSEISVPIVQASNRYRYIHYIIIGAGSEEGGGGALIEAYFDMKQASLDHPTGTYTLSMSKGDFNTGVASPTIFEYKIANGGSLSEVIAGGATDLSGGLPLGYSDDPYTTCVRVLPGKGLQGNIKSGGFPGQESFNYGAGENTGIYKNDGYFWYTFTNKPPQQPAPAPVQIESIIEPPPPSTQEALEAFVPNPLVVPYFGTSENNSFANPIVWTPPPPPSLPPPPPPLGVAWDSNYNTLSYPSFTKTFKGANYIHYVLIGAGQDAPNVIPPTISNTISGENIGYPTYITLYGPAYVNVGEYFSISAGGDWETAQGFDWKQDGVQNFGFLNPGSAWTAPSTQTSTTITYTASNTLEGTLTVPILNPNYSHTETRGGTTKPNFIKLSCPSTVFCGDKVQVIAEGDWNSIPEGTTPWTFKGVVNTSITGEEANFYAPSTPQLYSIRFTLNGLISAIDINVIANKNANALGNSGAYMEGYIDIDQLPKTAKISASTDSFGNPSFVIKDLSNNTILSETVIDAAGNNIIPSQDYTYLVSNIPPNVPANNAPGLGFKGLDGNTYGAGGGFNNDPPPEQGYWGFELTRNIPLAKSWNSETNSTDYPKNIDFFNGKYNYLHYILIGSSRVLNSEILEQGGLIEAYLDLSGQSIGTIAFQEGPDASFNYNIGGKMGEARVDAYGNGTIPDPNSISIRKLNGQTAPLGKIQPQIGPDGLPKGSYWWFELTNKEPPPFPSDKSLVVADSNNIPSDSDTTTTTTTNPNDPQTVTIKIENNNLKYLHYIIIGAGANGNQTGGGGAVIEAYVDLAKADISGAFDVTFTKGVGTGDYQSSAFQLSGLDISGGIVNSSALVIVGDSTTGGKAVPASDNFTFTAFAVNGFDPTSTTGGQGHESYDGTIYGAGGNADGNDSQAGNGYWWYELTNNAPLAQSWSSLNPSAVPTTTNFFDGYTYLHYILIGGGNAGFGNTTSGGGGGAYLEGYLDLTKTGKGVINFSFQQTGVVPTCGHDAVFTYIGTYGNISQAVAGGGGAYTDVSGGLVIPPYDLNTNVAVYSNGNDGNPVIIPGQAPPPAKGFLGPDNRSYGDGGTNYNILDGGLYPGTPFWWFEFTSNKPPNPTSFDSTSGIYPTDLTGYGNFRYMRYVLIGAGSLAGGTGSLLDVFLDLDQVGRSGKLTITQGNIDGSGVNTSIKFGNSVFAQAGGTKDNKGGYAIAPKDDYSIVNNIQNGMSSDLSGNPLNVIDTDTYLGFQGLNGNYYGGCDSLAAGIGYWGVEFTNRGPANNVIVHLADPVQPVPPVEPGDFVPPQPLVIPIIIPKKNERGATRNKGVSDLSGNTPVDLSGNITVDLSGNSRGGASRVTIGVVAIPPITVPFADISGSFPPNVSLSDLSGGLVANITIQTKTNPAASGETDLSGNPIEPVIKTTVIKVPMYYDPIGRPPDYKPGFVSDYTADPNVTLIDETGDITVQSNITTTDGLLDVFSGPPSTTPAAPGLLEAKMKADLLPYDDTGNILNDLSGNPTIVLSGNGITGEVNVQLKGLFGKFNTNAAWRGQKAGAPITGTIKIKASINKDPTLYTYSLPIQNNGNEIVIAGSGNLNAVTDVTAGPAPDFVNTIQLTINGQLLSWQPDFTPVAPKGDYLPPKWVAGDTYGIYVIENILAGTYYRDFVYDPERLLFTLKTKSFDFASIPGTNTTNGTFVVASTVDGMSFVYSNPIVTNNETGILALEKTATGYSITNSNLIQTNLPIWVCFTTDLTADTNIMNASSFDGGYRQKNIAPSTSFFWPATVEAGYVYPNQTDLMSYPLQLAVIGSNSGTQTKSTNFIYIPTPVSISEPDVNNKISITLSDISGSDISGATLKPEPASWNFTNTKALYGVYMSNDSTMRSEDITKNLRNLVSQINIDKYQVPQAIGNNFANKFLVSTRLNGKNYYSNYIIIDTGVYGGYFEPLSDETNPSTYAQGKFYFSTNFTPVPIAIPEPGGVESKTKYKYIVYTSTEVTLTPAQIVAKALSVTNTNPKTVWVTGTDDPYLVYESLSQILNPGFKVVVSASPDGANINFSQPTIIKTINTTPLDISYDKANKSLSIPFLKEGVPYQDINLPPGVGPVNNVIYTAPVVTNNPPAINFTNGAWTYYDYIPAGAATYNFTKPLPTPCYLIVSYSINGSAPSTGIVSKVLKFLSLTTVTVLARENRNYKYAPRPKRNKNKNKLYYAVSPSGGAAPPIATGDTLSVYGFSLGISNGAQYSLDFPNPISYYAACLLKGTTVLTPTGFVKIENLKVGDLVLSHRNKPVKVLSIGVWRIEWTENIAASDLVYKVAKGVLGAKKPLYISAYHRILYNGEMETANAANLPLAKKHEVCEADGFYTYYNIMVENHTMNNLVVNGEVVVESWDGKYPEEKKDAPAIINPYAISI